jgi:hypothetical protein
MEVIFGIPSYRFIRVLTYFTFLYTLQGLAAILKKSREGNVSRTASRKHMMLILEDRTKREKTISHSFFVINYR